MSVIDGTKLLYTINGELTTSFDKAYFILSNQQKIVREGDKYFILSIGQDIERLSIEEKERGERAYLRLRPDIMGVKQLVQHNHRLEKTEHNEAKTRLLALSEIMQQDISLLVKQLTHLQTAQTNTTLLLKQSRPTLTPILTPLSHSSEKCLTSSYRHMLQLICRNPTPRSIQWLKESQSHANNSPELQKQLNALQPGKPIPPQIMTELLKKRNLGRLWLDVRNPDAMVKELTNAPTAPSPFSMTPFKRNPA